MHCKCLLLTQCGHCGAHCTSVQLPQLFFAGNNNANLFQTPEVGRGRPLNAPAAFIHPCQPIIAKQPPTGPGSAHELKHDGYRLQIHYAWTGGYVYTRSTAANRIPHLGIFWQLLGLLCHFEAGQ
jgi:hypothetical protein